MSLPTKAEWNAMGFSVPDDLCADEDCPTCRGEGELMIAEWLFGTSSELITCRTCGGTGRLHKRTTEQEHNRTPKGRWT